MAYANEGIDQRLEVLRGAADSLVYFAKANGKPQTIDANSAWVTILDAAGSTKVERTQTGVVIASGGRVTYSRTWAEVDFELWEDYVMEVEYQVSAAVTTDRVFFDVVKTKLPCLIDNSDLLDFYPDLEEHVKSLNQSGISSVDTIAGFIRVAWSQMLDRIRAARNRPSLILDRARLVNPGRRLALSIACEALSREEDDQWDKRAAKHEKAYDKLFLGLGELKYDKDEDGLASEEETKRVNRRKFTV